MQDSNINFDDFFRARLHQQEAAVAPDMFERIMRERKQRKKPLFWWSLSNSQKTLLGGLLLLSASFLGWKYFIHQNILDNQVIITDEPTLSSGHQSPRPNTTQTPPILTQGQADSTEKYLSANNNSHPQATVATRASTPLISKDVDMTNNELSANTPPSVGGQQAEASPKFATNLPIITTNNNNTNIQNIENQPKNIGLTIEKLEGLDFLNTKKLLPLANLSFQTPNDMQGVLDEGCKSFNKKKKKLPKPSSWFLDAYGSPDYAMRRLQNVSGDFQSYIQARDTTEARWYAFSAGVRVSRVFKSSVALRAGLHYAQINEIFDYKQHDFTRITRTTVEIRDVSGALLRVDTVQKVEIGLRQRTDYNRYRSIDLPLQLGYELGNKSITWSGNLGLNLNLYSWQSGKLLNTDLVPTEVENSQAFRTQVGLSIFASVGCYVNINRRWQFLFEPNIRYQIGSWTRNNYPLRQDYTTLGFFTGVRYRFEKKKRFFF